MVVIDVRYRIIHTVYVNIANTLWIRYGQYRQWYNMKVRYVQYGY